MALPENSTGPLCEADPDRDPAWCAYHRTQHPVSTNPTVEVTVTIRASVSPDYGAPEVLDAVSFHLGLSDLDSVEADVSAIHITSVRAAGVLATPAPDTAAVEALARLTSDLRAVVAKVDRSWGGAAMVVRDSVAHLLGDRCTNEFCEHDHVAIRAALAPRATTEGSE